MGAKRGVVLRVCRFCGCAVVSALVLSPQKGFGGDMKCYQCDEAARGACRFCGAGICHAHAQARRFVSGVTFPAETFWQNVATRSYDFVVIDNALWCGRCAVHDFRRK